MREIFEEIAKEERADCNIEDSKTRVGGVVIFEATYDLSIDYNGKLIRVHNILGGMASGELEMLLPKQSDQTKFEITTKSPFSSLFSRKKERVKISSKDHSIIKFFNDSSELQKIQDIIKDTGFEPYIKGKNTKYGFLVRTEYHLAFEERREVIRPLIALYKSIAKRIV
jgi:hypothetical protein